MGWRAVCDADKKASLTERSGFRHVALIRILFGSNNALLYLNEGGRLPRCVTLHCHFFQTAVSAGRQRFEMLAHDSIAYARRCGGIELAQRTHNRLNPI